MAKKKKRVPGKPTLNIQTGTTRTIYATWKGVSIKKMDGYAIAWYYYTGNKSGRSPIWFSGSSSTTKVTNSTYTPPSNAISVKFTVRPNPANKANWKGVDQSSTRNVPRGGTDTTPSAPSISSVTISDKQGPNGYTVTATVANYQNEHSNGKLKFQIVEDDLTEVAHPEATIIKNGLNVGLASVTYDKAKVGGHRYKARVLAYGKHGETSEWSNYFENKYTPPDKATIDKLTTITFGTVDVSWTALAGADSYTLEYTNETIDGVPVFDTSSSAVQRQDNIKTTHFPATSLSVEPGKEIWYFRLQGVGSEQGSEGEWSEIKSTPVGKKPDIPTVWCYTTVGKVGDTIVFNWSHNAEDGSEQSGAKVGIKINDGEETVIDTLTTETSYPYDTAEAGLVDSDKINWRICTRGVQGIADEWSDWSEYREVVVYSPPAISFSVGVVDPDETDPVVKSFPIQINATSTPPSQTPVAYTISIASREAYDISGVDGMEVHVNIDEEIYSNYIPSANHNVVLELNPGDLYLNEGTVYKVTMTVAMQNGLTAEASNDFIAKWEIPKWSPDADIFINQNTLSAYIRPFCSDEWEFEYRKGFTLAVYRIDFDSHLTLIQSGIPAENNSTITDLHPSLDYARYRIVATDLKTGVVSYEDPEPIPVNAGCAVIQWDGEVRSFFVDPEIYDDVVEDWSGTVLRLPYNVDVSDDISPDVSLIEYIGRPHPVSYYGTQEGSTSRWNVEVPKSDVDTLAKIRALAVYKGDVYVREPYGTGYWANIKVSYTITHNKASVPVSFSITRVEGGA